MKPPLNFRKILGFGFIGFAYGFVDIFLTGDNDPGSPIAQGSQLFGNRLQGQHELGVVANELPDFVDQKDDARTGFLSGQIVP